MSVTVTVGGRVTDKRERARETERECDRERDRDRLQERQKCAHIQGREREPASQGRCVVMQTPTPLSVGVMSSH